MSTYINNSIKVTNSTNSTSNTTGAITVSGGIGVTGNIQSNGYIGVGGAIGDSTYPLNVTGASKISSYLGVGGAIGNSTYPLDVNGNIGYTGTLSYSSLSGTTAYRNVGVNGADYTNNSFPLKVNGDAYISTAFGFMQTPGIYGTVLYINGACVLSGSIGVGGYGNYSSSFSVYDTTRSNGTLPHYYAGAINATSFNIYSDFRVKKDIIDINTSEALVFIKTIEPKRFQYIDAKKGTDTVYGFIAQDLEQIMPELVRTIPDYIPDIYDTADTIGYPGDSTKIIITLRNKTLTFDNLDTEINIKASRQSIFYGESVEIIYHLKILKILSNTSFVVEKDLKLNLDSGHEIFIYGKKIDDFKYINQDIIYSISTAALQEFDKMVQEESQKDSLLLQRVAALEVN